MGAWYINPNHLPDKLQQRFLRMQFKQAKTSNPELSLEAVQLHLRTTTRGFNKPPRLLGKTFICSCRYSHLLHG